MLAKQFELAKIDEAKDAFVIQVLDKAIEPDKKSKPRHMVIVLVSATLAALIAILWAFVKESAGRATSNPKRAERLRALWRHLAWRR